MSSLFTIKLDDYSSTVIPIHVLAILSCMLDLQSHLPVVAAIFTRFVIPIVTYTIVLFLVRLISSY